MTFQNKVNLSQVKYFDGDITRDNPINILPFFAEDENCIAGKFVFAGTNPTTQVKGIDQSATSIVGIVKRLGFQSNIGGSNINSLSYNKGSELTIVLTGFIAIRPSNKSKHNDEVYVNPTTGEIQTGTTKPENFIETGFRVFEPNGANELCEIYKL